MCRKSFIPWLPVRVWLRLATEELRLADHGAIDILCRLSTCLDQKLLVSNASSGQGRGIWSEKQTESQVDFIYNS